MDTTYLYYYYGFGILYFFLGILNHFYIKRVPKIIQAQHFRDALPNVKKLEQQEPSNKPPSILSVIMLICSFPLLAFAIFAIWEWSSGKIPFNFDPTILLFSLLFVIFPMYILIDTFFLRPRQFRQGRSRVAKEATIYLDLDVDPVFSRCLNALAAIQANIIRLERPKYVIALIDKSRFLISIKHTKDHTAKINVICDAQWLTVTIDNGANRKYLNQFIMAL